MSVTAMQQAGQKSFCVCDFIFSEGMKHRLVSSFHMDSGSIVGWLKCMILKNTEFPGN